MFIKKRLTSKRLPGLEVHLDGVGEALDVWLEFYHVYLNFLEFLI
jgi:hypothetical protein